MSRWLKITVRIFVGIIGIVLVLWLGIAAYVYSNKNQLLTNITTQLNENINGKLTIEQMEPALLRGFPGISVSLSNVLLRDSLWYKHKHDLINARTLFISVDVFSLVTGGTRIRNLTINDGEIYLFTDSNGISNTALFKKDTTAGKSKKEGMREKINRIRFNNVQVTVDNRYKKNLFRFLVDNFQGDINYASSGWKGRARINTLVENFGFNTRKGSFMKNKVFAADLNVQYIRAKQQLIIPPQKITIGSDEFNLDAEFGFGEKPSGFRILVEAPAIQFRNAAALLTQAISSKLKDYNLYQPIFARATILGNLKGGGEPLIKVLMNVKDNTLTVSGQTITDCSFTGRFTNEVVKGNGFTDPNSAISLHNLSGKLYDIPFKSDSIQILNLKYPVFTGLFKSDFKLSKLNKALGENFDFNDGNANLNLLFKMPFDQNNKSQRYIYGTIKVNNASMIYLPRSLPFKNTGVTLNFKGRDLFLENMRVQTGNTSLQMQASLLDFSNLYYTDPGKLVIDWKVQSPRLNLNEFLVFLGKRKENASASKTGLSRRLDQMLDQANMRMRLHVNSLIYKRFKATNVRSDIVLKEAGISIRNLSLKQGGGSLNINGDIAQTGPVNQFNINTKINNVDVQQLFYAFENFGQTAISDLNLRGKFFGATDISGSIRDNGEIVPRSFKGNVTFDLRNGALVNFEPMQKIGAFAFPNRDFTNITFRSLKNTLNIQGNKVYIPPMEIESSVINIFAEGVYSFTTGTNIALKVPLRNPKKDEMIADEGLKAERALKGIVINLMAIDGEDGKVKFKLGKRAPDGNDDK